MPQCPIVGDVNEPDDAKQLQVFIRVYYRYRDHQIEAPPASDNHVITVKLFALSFGRKISIAWNAELLSLSD